MPRETKCHIACPSNGGHLLNPQRATSWILRGPPLESHVSWLLYSWYCILVFPRKWYCKTQLEIILNISNKDTTYTRSGKTDRFHKCVLIMARCCNTIRIYLRPQEFHWGEMASELILLFLILLHLAAWVGGHIQSPETVVPGMHEAHYEPDTINPHQFSN